MRFLCYSEEPAKQTDSKGVASAQGRGIFSGFVTKHFAPRLTDEEHKHAYALMVKAHSAAILPNDIPEYRQYLQYISHGGYSLPHRTKTTELEDAAVAELLLVLFIKHSSVWFVRNRLDFPGNRQL